MSADFKEVARRYREELWNRGALGVAEEIFAATCVHHTFDPITPALEDGPEGAKNMVTAYRTAFPDTRFTFDDLFAEGDRVLIRWTAQGTHTGSLMGVAPTQMKVTVHGMDVYRVAEGKIQEIWINWDTMGFMQQLGLEPLPASAKSP
jgi:steroid delta-isomerase-like uncharacterized protein